MKFDPDKNVVEILSECLQEVPFSKVPKSLNSPIPFALKEFQIIWQVTLSLKLFRLSETCMTYKVLQLTIGVFRLFSSMGKVHFSLS